MLCIKAGMIQKQLIIKVISFVSWRIDFSDGPDCSVDN